MNILTREHVNRRLLVIVAIITAALLSIGIWLTFSLLRPTPPRSVAMAIDPEGSFSAEVGKRYREFLARDGIDLRAGADGRSRRKYGSPAGSKVGR